MINFTSKRVETSSKGLIDLIRIHTTVAKVSSCCWELVAFRKEE